MYGSMEMPGIYYYTTSAKIIQWGCRDGMHHETNRGNKDAVCIQKRDVRDGMKKRETRSGWVDGCMLPW